MSLLPTPAPAGSINRMGVKAQVQLDFHLSLDGEHTLASTADISPQVELVAGDFVEATDGDITRPAVVDSVDGDTLSLVVLWDAPATVA